ncbi:MAG: arylesterase [Proteobacteria bacterium]|nr:arylesterase [Pseudomonadota bacterium]
MRKTLCFLFVMLAFGAAPRSGTWAAASTSASGSIRILALGDSLTAGYGLANLKDSFPQQLEAALKAKGHNVTIIQGGVSGDTTTGGRSRLDWVLGEKPDAVIVALGGNDALRAVDPAVTLQSMDAILKRIKKDNLPVLVAGMMAPPNLGKDYGDRFNAVFPKVAKDNEALLYPFFLEGVAGIPNLNQPDRIHPTPDGVKIMVKGILPSVEKLIAQVPAKK